MGLFSGLRGRRDTDPHEPPWFPSSSGATGKHRSRASDRRPAENINIRDADPQRPINSSRGPPHPPAPRNRHSPDGQHSTLFFHRRAEDLYEESFHDITPHTGTNYPCSQNELNASGGTNRRTVLKDFESRKRSQWSTHPNNGPYLDARKAAREVFDHNDPESRPSATGNEAIDRLLAGFTRAGQHIWGPDLAIKAFCDLDKVFFCGRLKGHVCLTWKPDRAFSFDCWGDTTYLGAGKCVIRLNAYGIFFRPIDGAGFVMMFATMLHEMW